MNDTIEAIRAKFKPAPARPSGRVERELHSERLSLRQLGRRGLHGPERAVRAVSEGEADLERRLAEARQAFSDATAAEASADAELARLRRDNGPLTKLSTWGGLGGAERHAGRCRNARLLAEDELREVLLERSAFRRRQEEQRQATEYVAIAARDRHRAARRRADGLPPLPQPERIALRSPVHFGRAG